MPARCSFLPNAVSLEAAWSSLGNGGKWHCVKTYGIAPADEML
jgi:hypothetical protein